MSAFSEAYNKLFPPATAREVYGIKPAQPVKEPTGDEQLGIDLRKSAQQTAELAGALKKRGWTVSVDIHPDTSDKGPLASVSIYRTQKLTAFDGAGEQK